jgi:large subunit ribosomal protein L6
MSRVGKKPITILPDVKVNYADHTVTVQGPLGTLKQIVHPALDLKVEGGSITVLRQSERKDDRSLHGLFRSLVANMVQGVKQGFHKTLVIEGIGFRGKIQGKALVLELGYSHSVVFQMPEGIKITVEEDASKIVRIIVSGANKQLVGQVAATIRALRPPEPYKGKGIRYSDEQVRRKAGKTATSQTGEK